VNAKRMRKSPPEKTLYSVLLLAYPRKFRVRFGSEMVDTFSEEMSVQRGLRGSRGAIHGWCSALWEVFSVAVPLRLSGPIVIPLLLSLAASSALGFAFFAAVTPHCMK
jgi:hypothetical protein